MSIRLIPRTERSGVRGLQQEDLMLEKVMGIKKPYLRQKGAQLGRN
jgi:hypothetical protein